MSGMWGLLTFLGVSRCHQPRNKLQFHQDLFVSQAQFTPLKVWKCKYTI
jgi:hypothetical protein